MLTLLAPKSEQNRLISALADPMPGDLQVQDLEDATPKQLRHALILQNDLLLLPAAWFDLAPALLFPPVPIADKQTLKELIALKQGTWEPSHSLLTGEWRLIATCYRHLEEGSPVPDDVLQAWTEWTADEEPAQAFRYYHNAAIVRHYGYTNDQAPFPPLQTCYEAAIHRAPNSEMRAFSRKHFATLLQDADASDRAEALLLEAQQEVSSEEGRMALQTQQVQLWMGKLSPQQSESALAPLKQMLWECLQYCEQTELNAHAGMLLIDATRVANVTRSFSEALGYISRAINLFDQQEIPEFMGHAYMEKGILLGNWAQNGQPQFYRPAVEAYQQALRIFTQELAPDAFAEIHHQLGILYSEMPDEHKKRSIWAAVSASSFHEALNYYDETTFPYEYAMVCNNYGNALMRYPKSKRTDHVQKAMDFYREALRIRQPEYFPYERALTLLNFLEASWKVGNTGEQFNHERYQDMRRKAEEVKTLVKTPELIAEANRHLEMLDHLIEAVEENA